MYLFVIYLTCGYLPIHSYILSSYMPSEAISHHAALPGCAGHHHLRGRQDRAALRRRRLSAEGRHDEPGDDLNDLSHSCHIILHMMYVIYDTLCIVLPISYMHGVFYTLFLPVYTMVFCNIVSC